MKSSRLILLKFILSLIIILQNFIILAAADIPLTNSKTIVDLEQCSDIADKTTLTINWRMWEPYAFSRVTPSGHYAVTGLDIELINTLSKKIGINLEYKEIEWDTTLMNIQNGVADVTSGATYTEERAKYANFSLPYRFEEISLFSQYSSIKQLNFHNTSEFLAQLRLLNFRLGISLGAVYGDPQITAFLNNQNNNDIIIKFANDLDSFSALIRNEIDGFICDRIVGVSAVLSNNESVKVKETPLGIKVPIHLMFSKKTVSLDLINHFNNTINEFIRSDDYKQIVKGYIYHVLLPKAIDSEWCYIIGLIGSIAFALSGLAIAVKENTTFFGTFLFALLPSIGGCLLLDIIVTRDNDQINFDLTPFYTYYVFITVLIGFATIKLLDYYNKQLYEEGFISKLWNNTLIICDALGQASFIVIGVASAIVVKIEPLAFWGPFLAFLAAHAGSIIRDLLLKERDIKCLDGRMSAEISILWGLIFSILLDIHAYNPDYSTIEYSMITVIAGAFVTKLLVYYFNVPNLRFRVEGDEAVTKV